MTLCETILKIFEVILQVYSKSSIQNSMPMLYSTCFETVISFKYRNQNTRALLFEIKAPKNQM